MDSTGRELELLRSAVEETQVQIAAVKVQLKDEQAALAGCGLDLAQG